MAERFKALVLKTSDTERYRGFESLSLRQLFTSKSISPSTMQKYPSGRRGSPAKGVDWDNRCEGSNPSFCAKRTLIHKINVLFLFVFWYMSVAFVLYFE